VQKDSEQREQDEHDMLRPRQLGYLRDSQINEQGKKHRAPDDAPSS
jgi:hypothetical protein